ncbi:hypothetical protein ABKS89_28940 [Pseudomonas sp. LABIM340]|uniref:hypothetical protein n=1 Tax=Pseudomonas sp. LABIM340 TaxID=3156585 RepID=UPI0032AEB00E
MKQRSLAAIAATALQLAPIPVQAENAPASTPQEKIILRTLREAIPAEKPLGGSYLITQREAALRYCLNINYEKIGAYKTEDLRDYSEIESTLDTEKSLALTNFIAKKTGHFYTENLPIQMEKSPPYNAIFARCMHFYKSRELIEFIKKLEE